MYFPLAFRLRDCAPLLMLVLVCTTLVHAQNTPSCATIWNGFAQSWGYPHPLARLGNGLLPPADVATPCQFQAFHAAAPGGRADQLRFRQYALQVDAPGVGFFPESTQLLFDGREGEDIRATATGSIDHADLLDPATSATLLLNGFDLRTQSGTTADQPGQFALQIDTTWVDAAQHRLHYRLSALMNFACTRGDCKGFEREVHYQLDVHMLALIGGGFRVGPPELLSSTQTWTRDSILAVQPRSANLLLQGTAPLNIPVITGFSVSLSAEFPLLGWEAWLTPTSAPPSGLLKYNYGLGVRQWDAEMEAAYDSQVKGFLCRPGKALLQRRDGSALSTLSLRAVQFQSGTASPYLWDATLAYPGKSVPADDARYVKMKEE